MILFLDLEETLIDDWHSGMLLPSRVAAVRDRYKDQNPTVGLMSWAVYHDADKETFNNCLREYLENALEMKFSERFLWSMDDWAKELFRHYNKKFSREDLFDCFGKHECLFALMRKHPAFKDQHVVLVDDIADHGLTCRSDANNCTLEFVNVMKL